MKNLSELDLLINYRKDEHNIAKDFYLPCLKLTKNFKRAVGFFTSSSLSSAADGLAHLIHNNGDLKLVASPKLNEEDVESIRRGESARDCAIRTSDRTFKQIKDSLKNDRLGALAWMIAEGKLEIMLAIPSNSNKIIPNSMYHEKIGLFEDIENNKVAFEGSSNESEAGLEANFESVRVFWSWESYPNEHVESIEKNFDNLWSNTTKNLSIIDFTDVSNDILKYYRPPKRPPIPPEEPPSIPITPVVPQMPSWIVLRKYQEDAINNWIKNKGKGTLQMATGSGKTITALSTVLKLYNKKIIGAAIILCPYKHLVDQWNAVATQFNFNPILAYEDRNKWSDELNRKQLLSIYNQNNLIFIITTNWTFRTSAFQNKLKEFPKKSLIIGDEAHNLGAKNINSLLPEKIPYRMALSATPERWFDDEGTNALFGYFGKPIEPEFTLKDALGKNEPGDPNAPLCPYNYYPILVELKEEETDEYHQISEKLVWLYEEVKKGAPDAEKNYSIQLLKRARIMASARNKLLELKKLMKDKKSLNHWLFYCGDSNVNDPSSENEIKQISAIQHILGTELEMRVAKFIAETDKQKRIDLINDVKNETLQGLIAIRCLDEGVDIPSISRAVILASSTNPRQFIQRRGRVLRKPNPKSNKIADIYDMVVRPPVDSEPNQVERSLLKKELSRVSEFSRLSYNKSYTYKTLMEIKNKYDLYDI